MKNYELRRKDKCLSEETGIAILEKGLYGFLGTSGLDKIPYCIPLNYVYHENSIYIHCALEGRKIEIIKENPNICFCVVGKAILEPENFACDFQSVMAEGKAEIENEPAEIKKALNLLIQKYSKDFADKINLENCLPDTSILKIIINTISCKGKE